MFVSLLRISNPNRPRFGPDPPRVRTQRFGWLHYLRLATTELQPVTRLLDLAVASTKSSSLAPVVGAVVPLMASKKGGLGDEVGWLVGWLVGEVPKANTPDGPVGGFKYFGIFQPIWIGLELLVWGWLVCLSRSGPPCRVTDQRGYWAPKTTSFSPIVIEVAVRKLHLTGHILD